MLDLIAFTTVRILAFFSSRLPSRISVGLLSPLLRYTLLLLPGLRRTLERNLKIAYPDISANDRTKLIARSFDSLARVFVDFTRMGALSKEWTLGHVECPFLPRFLELKRMHQGKGVLIATGHLGSFELLAHYIAIQGYPISFVVRDFKLPRLDRWWREVREAYGNRVISRRGAFKILAKDLQQGRDVAMLIDQNITRKHAVFVDWFGVKAATARSLAVAAIRNESPVIVAGIRSLGSDRYRIDAEECDFSVLYNDQALSTEKKIEIITQRVSAGYEQLIRNSPHEWFWLHRRWKTRPEGELENLYK